MRSSNVSCFVFVKQASEQASDQAGNNAGKQASEQAIKQGVLGKSSFVRAL